MVESRTRLAQYRIQFWNGGPFYDATCVVTRFVQITSLVLLQPFRPPYRMEPKSTMLLCPLI